MNGADAEARRVIHTRSGVGATANIIQREALRFSRLTFDQPTLVVVRHGEKIFASAKGEWRVKSGEAVAIAKGHRFDITNRPDARGSYQANWLVFEPEMLQSFASVAASVSQPVRSLGRLEIDFIEAFARARDAIENRPSSQTRSRVTGWRKFSCGLASEASVWQPYLPARSRNGCANC